MNINEKASYLKGLAEGLGIDDKTKEGKLLLALVDAFEELAEETTLLQEDIDELQDYVEELDSDLGEVESELYDDEEDCECGCDDCDEEYSVICPTCNESVFLDEEDLDEGELECPYCGKKIELEFDEDDCCCDDGDCECGCNSEDK